MTSSKKQLDAADQQLTGFAQAKSNPDVIQLIESMGLTKSEWLTLKREGRTRLNASDTKDVDAYFEV